MKKVYNIMLTGGPCAGKSSALEPIKKRLSNLGYNVIIVNETATEMINNGISPLVISNEKFQYYQITYLLQKEELYRKACLELNKPSIILYDRGTMDCKAYLGEKKFASLCQKINSTEEKLRNRYDLVLCFQSVANGAEHIYSKANNSARLENLNEAKIADKRNISVWLGHPNLKLIKNQNTFEKKVDLAFEEICNAIGLQKSKDFEK